MGVTLMTTTGTEADVRAALGLTAAERPEPIDAPVSATAETPEPGITPPAVPEPASEDSADAEEASATDTSPQAQAAKTKGRLQARIDELVAQRYHTQGELDAAKRQIEKLEAQLAKVTLPGQPAEPPTPPPADRPPQEADFETYDAYLVAAATYAATKAVEKRLAEKQIQDDEARQRAEQERVRTTLIERVQAFAKDHPDYEEAINNPALPHLTPVMVHYLTKPSNTLGPAMAYALAKDPDRFRAIAAMSPDDAAEEFGVLRAELRANGSKPVPAPAKTPAAPPPPTPVRGASVSATLSLEEMAKRVTPGDPSTSDWIARRNAELAKRGNR